MIPVKFWIIPLILHLMISCSFSHENQQQPVQIHQYFSCSKEEGKSVGVPITVQMGPQGIPGNPGVPGSKGEKGDKGMEGKHGEAGPKGDNFDNAVILHLQEQINELQETYSAVLRRLEKLENKGKYTFLGCFKDIGDRDMVDPVFTQHNSLEFCADRCAKKGFKYFGVQNGQDCWCGNSYNNNKVLHAKVPDNECNTPCTGNPEQMCGQRFRNGVFTTGV